MSQSGFHSFMTAVWMGMVINDLKQIIILFIITISVFLYCRLTENQRSRLQVSPCSSVIITKCCKLSQDCRLKMAKYISVAAVNEARKLASSPGSHYKSG